MKRLLCLLLLLPLFITTAYADLAEELDVSAVETALPEQEKEISGELTLDGSYDGAGALSRLWSEFCRRSREALAEERKDAVRIFAVAILAAVAAAVCPEKKTEDYIHLAACALLALLLSDGVNGMIARAVEAIEQLSDYSKAALPAIFTAAAISGASVSAPARYGAVCLALDVLMSISQRGIIPLIYLFLVLTISSSLFGHPILTGLLKIVKRAILMIMTVTTTVFTVYIGVTGIITASTDAAAVKTTKAVISTAFPVVGGILSDAAGSVLSAASVIKNAAGAFSLVAVSALCLGPFALLLAKWLLFRLAAAASDMIPGGKIGFLLEQFGTVMAMLLGMVGAYGMMLFFSITTAIRVVTP